MSFDHKKSCIFKLLLPITTTIVLVFIINCAPSQQNAPSQKIETSKLNTNALKSAIYGDISTNLEWLAGPDKPTNFHDAQKWIDSLTVVDGGGWRMPTIRELQTLRKTRNITPLLKTTGWWVWARAEKDSPLAMRFPLGFTTWEPKHGYHEVRVFAVRSRR